jgi:hypothetical protein
MTLIKITERSELWVHLLLTRITERLFPEKIPDGKRKKCVVRSSSHGRFRKTWIQWWCPNCKVGPCVEWCFSRYICTVYCIIYDNLWKTFLSTTVRENLNAQHISSSSHLVFSLGKVSPWFLLTACAPVSPLWPAHFYALQNARNIILIARNCSMFPTLINLHINRIKCQVRTRTANLFGALKLLVSYQCISIQSVKCV